jgi:asparagine synthase (glutamine-hydrolysing)
MSALAALFGRDGQLHPDEICALTRSMVKRGPHGHAVWQNGIVALGHAASRVLPEGLVSQPIRHPASGSAITFDGRLDARADLAGTCGIEPSEREVLSDAELLLHAYLARGESIFSKLLGDFAFVVWDEARGRLICGRDLLGMRPLFYTVNDAQVVVASELQAVLRGRPGKPNRAMVAEALTAMPASRHETLFDGVYRVPPGHALVVHRRDVRLSEFVRLEPPPALRFRTEGEYSQQFRSVFDAAVRDRLPSSGKAAVMLSGGIDSSTVFVTARKWADVDAYTVGYDDPALDETSVARATVARHGGCHHCLDVSAETYDYFAEIERYRDLPTNPSGGNSAALRTAAAANGVGVLLNGVGGDECFLGHTDRWTDWLVSGQWGYLWTELKGWRYSSDPAPWRILARRTVVPLVPRRVRRLIAALRRDRRPFAWVRDSFLQQVGFVERLRQMSAAPAPSYAVAGMIRGLVDAGAVAAWEEHERLAARFQQDDRMPYLDRRVMAFALAMPETLRSRPGRPKSFTRDAWRAQLPAEIICPYDAADYTIHVVDALAALGGRTLFADLAIADEGWVDAPAIRQMSDELFAADHTSREFIGHAWKLWAVAVVDGWYCRALH